MGSRRLLIITADDYGIGPATSHGILDLARRGRVTCAALLVNSPHAGQAVRAWRQAGRPIELGWHPCLTLDRPVLPARSVSTLTGPDGTFWPLRAFLRRLFLGRIAADEVEAELGAQYERFLDLAGHPPGAVNMHHHLNVFEPVGSILLELLSRTHPLPYIRRVREPWRLLLRVPGARCKRALLSLLGRRSARRQKALGFPGNEWLVGITDPAAPAEPTFFARWLSHVPSATVELACHPGYWDGTLLGRDGTLADGLLRRRVQELKLLEGPQFLQACERAGFVLAAPAELVKPGRAHAA